MLADESRVNAYGAALESVIGRETVVLDIGAGLGIMSFLACELGARRVYAVEVDDSIKVAAQIAKRNGLDERITFLQDMSTAVDLPAKADVIVSDLHGVLPWFGQHIPTIIDARTRMLAPGGVLIPRRDSVYVAVVDAPKTYERIVRPWSQERFGLDMGDARRIVTNLWIKADVSPDQLLSLPECWARLDYATVTSPNVAADIEMRPTKNGTAHGLMVWFDSELFDGISLSNAPGKPRLVYGSAFFPWSEPIRVAPGDTIHVRLRADLVGSDYVWSWDTDVHDGNLRRPKARYRQSTFFASLLDPQRLRRRAAGHRPVLGEEGRIDAYVLTRFDGVRTLAEVADDLTRRFPARFASPAEALNRVGDISERYCQTGCAKSASSSF